MNRLKEKRTARRQQSTRLISEAKAALETADWKIITGLVERLQFNHDELVRINNEYEQYISEEDFATEFEAVLKYEEAAKDMLGQLKAQETVLRSAQRFPLAAPIDSGHPEGGALQRIPPMLPILHLQTFSGELCAWPSFWEKFKALVHDNNTLTKGEKLQCLKSLLTGVAAQTIDGFQATGDCYDYAIDTLTRRFGGSLRMFQEHMARLRSTPSVQSSEDVRGLRHLVDHVQRHVAALRALNVPPLTYSTLMADVLFRALPADIIVGYHRRIALASPPIAPPVLPAGVCSGQEMALAPIAPAALTHDRYIQDFLTYLRVEVENRERSGDLRRMNEVRQGIQAKAPSQECRAIFAGPPKPRHTWCFFCGSQWHAVEDCDTALTKGEKLQRLARDNRCFRCTMRGHMAKRCQRRVKCKWCNGRHVASMCDPNWKPVHDHPVAPELPGMHLGSHLCLHSEVLLQTFRLWIVTDLRCAYIRGLIDGGSQRTFIREDVSKTLNLREVVHTNLRLHTFGQTGSVLEHRRIVEVPLRSQYDCTVYRINAIEVPFVCDDIPQIPPESYFIKALESRGQKAADKLLQQNMAAVPGMSLLIGADNLWKFMTGELHRYHGNCNIVALNSAFGWTFQGPLSVPTFISAILNGCMSCASAAGHAPPILN